jgi:hypothetical protein
MSYDYIVNTGGFPLISKKAAKLLVQLASDEVQLMNTEIQCKDGIIQNYKAVIVNNKIKGINREKSIYTLYKDNPNDIMTIRYLTYLPNCMDNYSIARDEDYSPIEY